jgi:hypothetical protein
MMEPIRGFTIYGGSYRAHVTIERNEALDIVAEAERRQVSVARVLRERVEAGGKVRRRKGAS